MKPCLTSIAPNTLPDLIDSLTLLLRTVSDNPDLELRPYFLPSLLRSFLPSGESRVANPAPPKPFIVRFSDTPSPSAHSAQSADGSKKISSPLEGEEKVGGNPLGALGALGGEKS